MNSQNNKDAGINAENTGTETKNFDDIYSSSNKLSPQTEENLSDNGEKSEVAKAKRSIHDDIDDEEILSAIRWHTTGKSDMSLLDKIIYIADMIEPSRDFDGVKEIRKITLKNLDKGVLAGINHTIKYLLEDDKLLDINTIEARNYLLLNK